MHITILGHVCIDHNISEHVTYTSAGSPALFITKIYQQFPGVTTQTIAPYGPDFTKYVKHTLIYPHKPTRKKTLIYQNISHNTVRTQKAINREYAQAVPISEKMKSLISSSDVIFFAPLTPIYSANYIKQIMKCSRKKSLKILLPQGYFRLFDSKNRVIQREFTEAREILPLFDFVIVSDQDHTSMNEYVKNWTSHTQVIVTRGDKGAYYHYKNKTISIPTVPVLVADIVDSVGSGDIFSASFGYQYFKTKNIKKSLQFANSIARQCLFYKADSLKITLV